MQIIKTMTLCEFESRLRALGISTSPEKTSALIEQGLFEGVVYNVCGKRRNYLILEKKFTEWVEKYADNVEPREDFLAFMEMQQEV